MSHISPRFHDALHCASRLHAADTRKGTEIPYISHLLAVCGLVLEHGGTEDEAIAALLHDAIEDADDVEEAEARRCEIEERFGAAVVAIVEGCTDGDPAEKASMEWPVRKQRYLAHLDVADDRSVLLVSCADKLHNARAILRDYRELGEELWGRFKGGRDGTLWYYGTLAGVYRGRVPQSLADELTRTVAAIARAAEG